jgi:hypothetical protein
MQRIEDFSATEQVYREQLAAGEVGCPMAKYATAHVCDIGDVQTYYQAAYNALADLQDGAGDTLVLIPRDQPETYEEGAEIARQIWFNLAHACRTYNTDVLKILEQSLPREAVKNVFRGSRAQHAYALPTAKFQASISALSQTLATSNYIKGLGALEFLGQRPQQHYIAFHNLFTFAMAPYYLPLIPGKRHPRQAPAFSLVVNFTEDISRMVKDDPAGLRTVRDWMSESTGHLIYHQAVYPPPALSVPGPEDIARLKKLGIL